MNLLPYLRRIAVADQQTRRNELLNILCELDCPFITYRERYGEQRPENIVVRFQPRAPQRLVIGAHYDSVPGSTGANDNGAGVCILLGLLQTYLRQPPPIPLDVVFFDLEEVGAIGSKAYLRRVSSADIWAMINLDICGAGDTILVAPRVHVSAGPLGQAVQAVAGSGRYRNQIVEQLPLGDDVTFEAAGIPNISVSSVPHDDVATLIEAVAAMRRRERPARRPRIVETFHNGPRDSIMVVEETAMQTVLQWVLEVVEQFK